jgi:hypothetical protein
MQTCISDSTNLFDGAPQSGRYLATMALVVHKALRNQ